ncbi:hypothetical protein H671_1g2611 [Cricetulus griseus]|nr:hypothetical protein H671_1g2611 [Cricetulus griseus]
MEKRKSSMSQIQAPGAPRKYPRISGTVASTLRVLYYNVELVQLCKNFHWKGRSLATESILAVVHSHGSSTFFDITGILTL